ncbi:palmitoyltransferase ZDHHC11 [Austrofundulus limnaeus]|uniref:Palmitoyltransferase n=1 Tax=Austrofundulus limnaeus TaxID=52670 RepID=A0A2I4B8X3_AUSLI|nr:PREDICTED: probable palmitoyltransferase ZDHHC11 [Austrofundulus limnaeus]
MCFSGEEKKKMSCFSQTLRRVSPTRGSSKNELVPSKPPRINGWSLPLQPLQVIGWLVFSYLAIIGFGVHIPLLPQPWSYLAYSVAGISFIVHFFSHIAAVTVDPADGTVRAKRTYSNPMPLFDRTKRAHVIQDQHCYLCDVKVGSKVKHCSSCNKCVEGFDHHCKWLNTCVGRRNYRFFFGALVSATVGVFVLVIVILFTFIEHYLNPHNLRTAPQFDLILTNTTWLLFLPLAPLKTTTAGFLILTFITVLLSTVCLLLLCHLLGFHLYLFYKGLSTFDYVRIKRQKESGHRKTKKSCDSKAKSNTAKSQDTTIDCEPALSQTSSFCKLGSKGLLTGSLSDSICTELENFKKSAEKENNFHYGTEIPTESEMREISMSVITGWSFDEEEDRSTGEKSVPAEQDPLGSSVVPPDRSRQ